jgi:hypothetical protein
VATVLWWRIVVSFIVHFVCPGAVVSLSVCSCARRNLSLAGGGRHIRVRFNAVVASANSTATFLSPRIRNRRIPRCSFKIPITGSTTAFRRRYNVRPLAQLRISWFLDVKRVRLFCHRTTCGTDSGIQNLSRTHRFQLAEVQVPTAQSLVF